MNNKLIYIVLASMLALALSSCNRTPLTGTWIDVSSSNQFVDSIGFVLNEDHTVTPINSGFNEFKTWERVGDELFLKGVYTGTNPHDFVDTMHIVRLKKDSLILRQGNYEIPFARR